MKRKKQRIAIAAAGIFLVAAAAFLILKPPADPLAAVPSELAEQVTLTPTENLPGHVVLDGLDDVEATHINLTTRLWKACVTRPCPS